MRKIYMKSLFVAAGLTLSASSFAQTLLLDYGTPTGTALETEAWTTSEGSTLTTEEVGAISNSDGLETWAEEGKAIKYTSPKNGSGSSTVTIAPTANSILTFEAVWAPGASTGRSGNRNFLQLGDVKIESRGQDKAAYIALGDDGVAANLTKLPHLSAETRSNYWWKVNVTVNQATGAIDYAIASTSGKSDAGTLSKPDGSYTVVGIGFTRGGRTVTSNNSLRSILVSERTQSVTTVNYTINYNYNGATLNHVDGTAAVGATVTAENPVVIGEQKYYAVDDAATSLVLAEGENVLNVELRLPKVSPYVVKNSFGDIIASGSYTEGDDAVTVAWSKYVQHDGEWYACDETSYSMAVSGEVDKTVAYSEKADIACFVESSALTWSAGAPVATLNDAKYSAGSAARLGAHSYCCTPAFESAGVYSLAVPYMNQNSTDGTIWICTRDAEGNLSDTGLSLVGAARSSGVMTAEGIVIPAGCSLVLNNTTEYNSNVYMDYVVLAKTPAPTVAIPAASKLASYSNAQAVTVPEDVTIYIATAIGENSVTLVKVEGKVVPANTGVILYSAEAGEKTLAFGGEAVADFSANQLKATAAVAVKASGAEYALVKGEQSFAKVAADVEIPANKAYIAAAAGAKLTVDFGQTTGLDKVQAKAHAGEESVYNLSGQQVDSAYKGIVIKGGKKFIVK